LAYSRFGCLGFRYSGNWTLFFGVLPPERLDTGQRCFEINSRKKGNSVRPHLTQGDRARACGAAQSHLPSGAFSSRVGPFRGLRHTVGGGRPRIVKEVALGNFLTIPGGRKASWPLGFSRAIFTVPAGGVFFVLGRSHAAARWDKMGKVLWKPVLAHWGVLRARTSAREYCGRGTVLILFVQPACLFSCWFHGGLAMGAFLGEARFGCGHAAGFLCLAVVFLFYRPLPAHPVPGSQTTSGTI